MNKELMTERVSRLNETLSDPKIVTGLVGLGICMPILLPSLIQSFPVLAVVSAKYGATITAAKVSSLLINGGITMLGGVSSVALADIIKESFKKEDK